MPFYEYECQACKFYTEVMQKISDPPLTRCPSCGKRRLTKLVSAPVFRLKGSGWYETDFKSDKEGKRNLLGAEKDEAKPESKVEAKEGKPEAKETGPEGAPAKPAAVKAAGDAPPAVSASATRGRVSVSARPPRAVARGKSRGATRSRTPKARRR
ncbi:MAG TPA: zinc ribbon domain-containing protein [Steroidobacteraceae bacterium]|nr:zinc ribbon domain-containing protein [Steroidobacteraceae bacterium]